MDGFLTPQHLELRSLAAEVTREHIQPMAATVDREASWPRHSMEALAAAGLTGLHVPTRLGGRELGLLALAVVSETIARGCPSSALCYAMHCVGSAVIAAKATPEQEERYLRPIAAGEHLTTLALSEAGTGAHFYLPRTRIDLDGDAFVLAGTKRFVTNGGHADSYVISTQAAEGSTGDGDFSCLVVDDRTEGMEWLDAWAGLGMRGNSSRAVQLDGVRVPTGNLLGEQGDQIWYVFEVVAPYFLIAMAATYLGVAQAALDLTVEHLRGRRYEHSGQRLSEVEVLQHRVAELHTAVARTRGLVYNAAHLGDVADESAVVSIMLAKADAADTAVRVVNEAMTCCGGRAYGENSDLARLLRDARASHVMAPTTDLLKVWAGRALLGEPIL